MDLDCNVKFCFLSQIFWKIRFPVRIDDNHYDSLFIYRLLPENEEILKMKSHAIIKEDFYKINNIFYTEYIGHEVKKHSLLLIQSIIFLIILDNYKYEIFR